MPSNKQSWINKNRLPNESDESINERYKEYMRSIASRGGAKKSPTKGFGHPNADPRAAGAVGGKKSKPFSRSIE